MKAVIHVQRPSACDPGHAVPRTWCGLPSGDIAYVGRLGGLSPEAWTICLPCLELFSADYEKRPGPTGFPRAPVPTPGELVPIKRLRWRWR